MSALERKTAIHVAAAPVSWGVFEQENDPLLLAPEVMPRRSGSASRPGAFPWWGPF